MFGSPMGFYRVGVVFQFLLHGSVSTHSQLHSLFYGGDMWFFWTSTSQVGQPIVVCSFLQEVEFLLSLPTRTLYHLLLPF